MENVYHTTTVNVDVARYVLDKPQLLNLSQILDPFKLREFADDNFKFDENVRKFSKRVENSVGKGEIARYEQFLLFPQCFQKKLKTADT